MAINLEPSTDLQATAEEAIEQTKEEACLAMDNYFDFLQKTISSCPTGGTQLGEKIKDYSERNIAVTREYLRNLSKARNFTDVARIQTAFMQSQFNAFGEQAKGLSAACSGTATDLVNKPFFGKAA
jgi:hypothetical protein